MQENETPPPEVYDFPTKSKCLMHVFIIFDHESQSHSILSNGGLLIIDTGTLIISVGSSPW